MRFFQEYNGFIFEFNSLAEFFKALLWRLFGTIVGIIIFIGILFFLYLLGTC